MREGAKYIKQGRRTLQGPVSASTQVLTQQILVDRFMPDVLTKDSTLPVYLDVRSVKKPSTKARNIRYRVAISNGWKANFSITWDKSLINREQMHAVLIHAGTLVGLGDGRSIGFGRFEVEDIEFMNYETYRSAMLNYAEI